MKLYRYNNIGNKYLSVLFILIDLIMTNNLRLFDKLNLTKMISSS